MNIVELPPEFTSNSLDDIHRKISEFVSAKNEYRFDGSQVKSVDAAAIQLLAVCKKSEPDCMEPSVFKPSEVLSSTLEFLDVFKSSSVHAT